MTKKKFNAYRKVQYSNITNMCAINVVMGLSNLTRLECLDIMKNYDKYEEEFGAYLKE